MTSPESAHPGTPENPETVQLQQAAVQALAELSTQNPTRDFTVRQVRAAMLGGAFRDTKQPGTTALGRYNAASPLKPASATELAGALSEAPGVQSERVRSRIFRWHFRTKYSLITPPAES